MLTLNDGRSELWQWDTGRTLSVDADCSQVHFSNKVFGRSIDVDVVDGAAIIPDILLQTDKDLNVWAFVGTAENGYTKISKTFTVNRRNKPADYVFTQTDQITLQTIQNQIGDLADLTTEAKDTLVAAINEAARTGGGSTVELDTTLTQSGKAADAKAVGDALAGKQDKLIAGDNITIAADGKTISATGGGGSAGIYVGDTAPSDTSVLWVDTSDNEGSTVDSVNGKTGTVVLTAEDVGAMPAGASVDYTLPVATAETLGGVKVGEGLSIDASGVLSASGGGSSGGGGGVPTWSLLGEYDMSTIADSDNISLTGLDNLTYLYFKWEALQNETSTDSNCWLSINGKQLGPYILSRKSGTSNYGYTICKWNGLVWEIQMSAGAISDTNYALSTGNALFPYNHAFGVGACTTLSVFVVNPPYKPVSGVLKIYGGK